MPATDYADPEIAFPRLEARVQKREADAFWIQIWLHEKPGDERHEILRAKRAGSIPDAHEIIKEYARAHGAAIEADDITVEM